jgi:hypothetical protein
MEPKIQLTSPCSPSRLSSTIDASKTVAAEISSRARVQSCRVGQGGIQQKAKAVQFREITGPPSAGLEVNQIQHANNKLSLANVNGDKTAGCIRASSIGLYRSSRVLPGGAGSVAAACIAEHLGV